MLNKISERVYYLSPEDETDRPCLYYIKGDKLSMAVDAGNSKNHLEKFYAAIDERGFRRPDITVITHWHWDHTFGLNWVKGRTIASKLTNEKLKKVKEWRWTREDMDKREATGEDISFCNECIRMEYEDLDQIQVCIAQEEVCERTLIDLGGIQAELILHDSTHSRDSLYIYIPKERMLFLGDADAEDHYENGGKMDQSRLEDLYEFLKGFDVDYYLIGHEAPQSRTEELTYLEEELNKFQ